MSRSPRGAVMGSAWTFAAGGTWAKHITKGDLKQLIDAGVVISPDAASKFPPGIEVQVEMESEIPVRGNHVIYFDVRGVPHHALVHEVPSNGDAERRGVRLPKDGTTLGLVDLIYVGHPESDEAQVPLVPYLNPLARDPIPKRAWCWPHELERYTNLAVDHENVRVAFRFRPGVAEELVTGLRQTVTKKLREQILK